MKTIEIKDWEYEILKKYMESYHWYHKSLNKSVNSFSDVIEALIDVAMGEGNIDMSDIYKMQERYKESD